MAGAPASTRRRDDSGSRCLRKTGSSLTGRIGFRASQGRRPYSASAGALRPKFCTLDPPPPTPDPLTQRYADVEHLLDCPCCRKLQHKLSSNPRVPDRDWAQRFTSSHGGLAWNVHHWSSVKSTYAQRQRPELYSCYEATSDYKSLPNMLRTQMKLCAIRQAKYARAEERNHNHLVNRVASSRCGQSRMTTESAKNRDALLSRTYSWQELQQNRNPRIVTLTAIRKKILAHFDSLEDAWNSWDADKSLTLDRQEFYMAMMELGIDIVAIGEILRMVDRDGGGVIQFAEFIDCFADKNTGKYNESSKKVISDVRKKIFEGARFNSLEHAFLLIDVNEDDEISREEFQAYMGGLFGLSLYESSQLFGLVDVTGDGSIKLDEFKACLEYEEDGKTVVGRIAEEQDEDSDIDDAVELKPLEEREPVLKVHHPPDLEAAKPIEIAPWLRFTEKQKFGPVVGKRARPPENRLVAAVAGLEGEQDAHAVAQAEKLRKRLQQAGLAEPDDTPSAGRRRSMTAPRLMLSTLDLLADDDLTSDGEDPEPAPILRKRPTAEASTQRQRARTSFAGDAD
mmetsp:Transcript_15657/g.37713  ORF Transcript_15657/g.37713 Transcript_15657/m.37713 type:complete len:567 (-) Transcript_15657:197-1897(-)